MQESPNLQTSMLCYEAFECILDLDFLNCINSNTYGKTVIDYCADSELVTTINDCIYIKLPYDNTIVKC